MTLHDSGTACDGKPPRVNLLPQYEKQGICEADDVNCRNAHADLPKAQSEPFPHIEEYGVESGGGMGPAFDFNQAGHPSVPRGVVVEWRKYSERMQLTAPCLGKALGYSVLVRAVTKSLEQRRTVSVRIPPAL